MKISPETQENWNDYWDNHKHSSRVLYDVVASFYRSYIIRPALNHFIRISFRQNSLLLHAGCGSGQVDVDIRRDWSVIPLDISMNALALYDKASQRRSAKLQGDILHLPFSDGVFDGIYNLGVMEHFAETEIQDILEEFGRTLKKGGKIILFWPPEYGMSVLFFKVLVFLFRRLLLRKQAHFHPAEVTRIRSKQHVQAILAGANFHAVRYYFGARDLFTYSVVVAEKNTRRMPS